MTQLGLILHFKYMLTGIQTGSVVDTVLKINAINGFKFKCYFE